MLVPLLPASPAFLLNNSLEIYDVIIITVVYPTYFSNLQFIIICLHK